MKYIDPCPITCPSCGEESQQRVVNLLQLLAACPICGAVLKQVGLDMRAQMDEWGTFCTLGEMSIRLEQVLGHVIADDDLLGTKTLHDLARLIEPHLPDRADRATRSIEIALDAARAVPWCEGEPSCLDAPLLDAVDPGRWDRPVEGY